MKIYCAFRSAVFTALVVLLLCCSVPSFAQSPQPLVSPLFTDNMVLQRGIRDSVWGWTSPGQTVTVTINNKSASAVAGPDGKWIAAIGPFKEGGPYTLTVAGPQTVTFSNVMVGDVWVCSGQSNMEFGIGNGNDAASEIAAANYPNIRIFTVAKTTSTKPNDLTTGTWQAVTPQTIASQGTWNGFSAVGYFFGRDLQQSLNVPIGLIQSSWGGTPAEAWTSADALNKNVPAYSPEVDALTNAAGQTEEQRQGGWYSKNDVGVAGNWQDPDNDATLWKPITEPGYFQQAGIPELQHINGIVWFRTQFDLPAQDNGLSGVVHLQVDDNDTTWINGQLVGQSIGVGVHRAYAVPSTVLKQVGNVIVVRCLDTGGLGGIYGGPDDLKLTVAGGQDVPLAGTWQYRISADLPNVTPLPLTIANNQNYPTELYNGMISPIENYGIKGALWYQGESNADNANRALQYRTLLPAMITDWRTRWNEGNFPFLIVQLANFDQGGPNWPELRQAQWLTAATLPNTGIATAIDIGNQTDIHPKNKQEVGRRLALVAEATTYGKKVAYSGPVYKSSTVKDSSIRISFTQTNGGLNAKGGAPLTGFEIAGTDGKFVIADATIDGNSVVVSSPDVPSPTAVQYDWSGYPNGNLYNGAGLPTFPFKTDEK
jgi:sialate O-acetylesterase